MLAEVLADRGDWSQVMPGVRACLFSLEKSLSPCPFDWSLCISRPCSVLPGR